MTEEKRKLEFGGVPGNLAMIIGLPIFTAYLFFAVRFNDGAVLPGPNADWDGFWQAMLPTWRAAVIYGAWFVFQALLQKYAPGREVLGAELPDGGRLPYRMNGLFSLIITFIASGCAFHEDLDVSKKMYVVCLRYTKSPLFPLF